MDDLERQLKRALAPKDAPSHFEAKVLSAVSRDEQRATRWRWLAQPLTLRWATVALAAVLLASGVTWQKERERAAGEQARAKLELALKITSEKLERIDREIRSLQNGE